MSELKKSVVVAIALSLGACATSSSEPHPLEGTSWRLVDVTTSGTSTQLTDEFSARHRLTFEGGGRLRMQLDCNRGNADWSASMPENGNGTLNIGMVASTKALCPPPTFGDALAAELSEMSSAYTLSPERSGLIIRTASVVYAFERD